MLIVRLKTPPVFSSKECLKFLGRSKNECLYSLEKGNVRKLFILDEMPVLVELRFKNDEIIELVFLNAIPSEEQIIIVKKYVENWFDLKNDLNLFYTIAEKDHLLSSLTKKYNGLKLIGIPDFYEAICWAVIGQQINLNFAYTVKRNLVEHFGFKFEFEGQYNYHFPRPEQVLSIPKQAFSDLKFSKQKADYILTISQNLAEGTLDFNELKKLDYSAAKSRLLSIRGVGNWTADYILMKTFRFPNAFPVQDAGFLNALKNLLKLNSKPNIETILQMAESWKGFEAYATFYLWRSLYD